MLHVFLINANVWAWYWEWLESLAHLLNDMYSATLGRRQSMRACAPEQQRNKKHPSMSRSVLYDVNSWITSYKHNGKERSHYRGEIGRSMLFQQNSPLLFKNNNFRLIFGCRRVECCTKCLLHQDMKDVSVTCGDGKKNNSLCEIKYERSISRDNKTTTVPLRQRFAKRPQKYKYHFNIFFLQLLRRKCWAVLA